MIDKVVVFTGSKKDFEIFLEKQIPEDSETIPFMELIQHYNARLRPNESGVRENALRANIEVDNCVVRADDYGSVMPHVLSNFANIVNLNYDMGTLYIQNPPRRVLESLKAGLDGDIEYYGSQYPELDRDALTKIYKALNSDVYGQDECKKQILSGMYRLTTGATNKPVVLMLYGPSGVGKTESAKSISKSLGGELLLIQFSMMQTSEAYDYVFGAEHSKSSFARDMMGRESNVILIDEFDKVNPALYNAFYELFDEGKYVDTNYSVELGQAIFLLTCNFSNENEIKKALGPAMFSRIGCCVEYADLTVEQKQKIVNNWYDSIMASLKDDDLVSKLQGFLMEKLSDAGFHAVTRMTILGRGKQRGLKVGNVYYDDIPKELIEIVVEDGEVDKLVSIIENNAKTMTDGKLGTHGDGKIFIMDVERAITISSGEEVL